MGRHDRVEEKVNAGERGEVSGGRARKPKAVTASGTANAMVHTGGEAAKGAGDKEGGERPF